MQSIWSNNAIIIYNTSCPAIVKTFSLERCMVYSYITWQSETVLLQLGHAQSYLRRFLKDRSLSLPAEFRIAPVGKQPVTAFHPFPGDDRWWLWEHTLRSNTLHGQTNTPLDKAFHVGSIIWKKSVDFIVLLAQRVLDKTGSVPLCLFLFPCIVGK